MNETSFSEEKLNTNPDRSGETPSIEIKYGAICPVCLTGVFDYDGLLNLVCPHCGTTAGGCFT